MGDFERKMDSKGYRFLKIVADLFVVNFEFLFTVIFSLTFLFFPSLFALIELCKKEKVTFIDNTEHLQLATEDQHTMSFLHQGLCKRNDYT